MQEGYKKWTAIYLSISCVSNVVQGEWSEVVQTGQHEPWLQWVLDLDGEAKEEADKYNIKLMIGEGGKWLLEQRKSSQKRCQLSWFLEDSAEQEKEGGLRQGAEYNRRQEM
jgi:hypothetical protein